MTRIVAFDFSLTATGFATPEGSGVLTPPKDRAAGVPRLQWLRAAVLKLAVSADLVVIEGYAWGAKGSSVISLGELGGVVRVALADSGFTYVEVNPSTVKKFATGKGNAKKDEMLAASIRKLGYEGHDHNEADALWLRTMACSWYGVELERARDILNQDQRASLEKVKWPTLNDRAAA